MEGYEALSPSAEEGVFPLISTDCSNEAHFSDGNGVELSFVSVTDRGFYDFALQHKDEELARLQGIDARYLQVKAKIDAVIGPTAKPAAADDGVAKENRRYLEPHRANIERLQRILRDPLSRAAEPK